jgi:hypothetical protein
LETALEYDKTLPEARQSLAQGLHAARHLSALTNGLLNLAPGRRRPAGFRARSAG